MTVAADVADEQHLNCRPCPTPVLRSGGQAGIQECPNRGPG